ncbi:MAG: homocysteine biosynthesis protein [Candidatus Odinarchaeota archaeon]
MQNTKTVAEINRKIAGGSVTVVTASEMTGIVAELGPEEAAKEVDVVTTGTFGAMCSSGAFLNFGHSEPPIRMQKVWLNGVEAYTSIAAVDAYIGATQRSRSSGMNYGGGHVIEDLVCGKAISLEAESVRGTDCYPRTDLLTEVNIDDLNQAIMCNPRNGYQRYNVATNSTGKTLYTYMGKLLPYFGNATFSGAGELSPLMNDPDFQTIGIGTRIFLCGSQGYIIGSGTQHSPRTGFGTLMVIGDLKKMSSDFIRGATFQKYGCTLYVGIGVPIPILNSEIASKTGITDEEIITNVLDYGVPSRDRPCLKKISYADLKSGSIAINGQEIKTSPVSSFSTAIRIAKLLKEQIRSGTFYLSQPVELLSREVICNSMTQKEVENAFSPVTSDIKPLGDQRVIIDERECVSCGLCLSICPFGVYERDEDWNILVNPGECTQCRQCEDICPHDAINLLE